jgi:hypothetical protein
MARERTYREESSWPETASVDGGNPTPARDYRDEVEASDEQLTESLNSLAQMFAPCDIVNRGAQ